ncbi:MAG: glutathione peroxidase [Parabacteroides sp.]|nr:glutathione peroxidase [Parabacteroides sp.]MDD4405550.1 glutathione peroxidase [Parabacteroides sp.]
MEKKFYSFKAVSLKGKEISMDQYKGKVVVIVNTASKCGFTPQYADLEKLYQQYKDKGLVILGFPCNQFGKQEPGTAKDISEGCLINYGVSFPMFAKVDVNGENAHPLFSYLKSALPGFITNRVKWNFTKFVIDAEGNPVKRYAPITSPLKMEQLIVSLLK